MKPVVAVVAYTESFRLVWSSLVNPSLADVVVVRGADELPRSSTLAAVLVAGAGGEETLAGLVRRVHAERIADVAAVGVSTDYHIVVSLLGSGATAYFALPGDLEALRSWVAGRVGDEAATDAPTPLPYDFSSIKGRSPKLVAALQRAAKVIPFDATPVLVTGETGTGKELLARAIHDNGPHASGPFVDINCAALPPGLLEAELFGYERGAFTDAKQSKAGLVESAHGGTLFLDEIGELPPELQTKLLRVLEARRVRRLGAVRDVGVDVRVIAATNADIGRAVRDGRFRRDLYYRLNVVAINLPPLRERGDDVLLLTEYFLSHFAARYAIRQRALASAERAALRAHTWPGNVRELRNVVERAVVLGEPLLSLEELSNDERELRGALPLLLPFPTTMETIERAAARASVERFNGNKTAAAAALGISRKHLYALLGPTSGEGGPSPHTTLMSEDGAAIGLPAIRVVR